MHILIKATAESALILGLGACSEQTSLEDFSTEDIVKEYHARFDAITENPDLPLSEFFDLSKPVIDYSPQEAAPHKETLNEFVSSLQPYADAGDKRAALIIAGVHLSFGRTPFLIMMDA